MPIRFSLLKLWRQGLWEYSILFQTLFVVGRLLELGIIIVRYLLIRVPILLIWTNVPLLNKLNSPWPHLQELFSRGGRSIMVVGEPIAGTGTSDSIFVDLAATMEDQLNLTDAEKRLLACLQGNVPEETNSSGDEEEVNLSDLLLSHKSDVLQFWRDLKESPMAESRRAGGGFVKTAIGPLFRGLTIEMGPAMIKLMQIMSMRPEMPPFLREEMQLVQDKVVPAKFSEVKQVLEKEVLKPYDVILDRNLDDYFEWIDEVPIASASLSQVHAAKLRDGREVALKVQRPYLDAILSVDKFIYMDIVVKLATKLFPRIGAFDISIFTSSFKRSLDLETDFVLESRTGQKFHDLIMNNPVYHKTEYIPQPYFEYCTGKLLVMELAKNFVRIDRLTDLPAEAVIYGALAYEIPEYPPDHSPVIFWSTASMWGDMILKWGLIHGDPHLGNLYVLMPKEELPICRVFLCDFGMVEEFPPEGLKWATDLFAALLYYHSAEKVEEILTRFTETPAEELRLLGATSEQFKMIENMDEIKENVHKAVGTWMERRLPVEGGDITFRLKRHGTGMLVQELLYLIINVPGISLPDWVWLLVKSLSYLETLGVTMWGGYDASDMFMPHVVTQLKEGILDELDTKDISNIKEYVEELSEPLSRPDLMDMLASFGK